MAPTVAISLAAFAPLFFVRTNSALAIEGSVSICPRGRRHRPFRVLCPCAIQSSTSSEDRHAGRPRRVCDVIPTAIRNIGEPLVSSEGNISVLKALEVSTGVVRTAARYNVKLELSDMINGTLKFNPIPDGQGFVTTAVSTRQNLWMLTGLR
jgi:hypothetical protein